MVVGYYWLFGYCILERIGEIMTELEILTDILEILRTIVALQIVTFCSACMRSWRNNTLKGGRR